MAVTSDSMALAKVADEVNRLRADMAGVGTLVGRLDITIEKLTEVSTTVSQLLAVQGNRIEFHEKEAEKTTRLIEDRRVEHNKDIKDVNTKVETVEADLRKDISITYEKVAKKIDDMLATADTQRTNFNKELNDRLSRIEKWIWSIAGGGLVTIWLANNIDIAKLFSN